MALLPACNGRRIVGNRHSNVMDSVTTAQYPSFPPAAGLRICLLGPLLVTSNGNPVVVPLKKARALLAYLVLRQGAEVSRNTLTALLWGERSEEQARASLRQTLLELRAALPNSTRQSIVATKEAVSWLRGSAWIDADR